MQVDYTVPARGTALYRAARRIYDSMSTEHSDSEGMEECETDESDEECETDESDEDTELEECGTDESDEDTNLDDIDD